MSATRLDRWLKRLLIAVSPLLAAPYFHSCITPTHGVFPLACTDCATTTQEALDKAEQNLREAQVTLADLRTFVAYKPCRTGRSALIQLGWVFFMSRSVPAYLKKTPFDAPAMITAFARYWDHVSKVLAQPENGGDGAQFVISIGNELNAYLSHPIADIDGDAASAWESYAKFYVKAARYVKGESVDLDGDGAPEPNLSDTAKLAIPPQPTFTLTMSDECDVRKIVNAVEGDYAGDTCLFPAEVQQRIGQALLAMIGEASFWTFTRYPIWDLSDNPTSDELAGRAHDGVLAAFQTFGDLSRKVAQAGYTPSPRPILMQEVGYPSSLAKVDDNLLLQQQAAVVRGAFAGWEDYVAPYRANALAAMLTSPPVLGFNWLPLHDFPPDSDGGCPVGGVEACSWGLIHPDDMPKPAWSAFVDAGRAVNPASVDQDPLCRSMRPNPPVLPPWPPSWWPGPPPPPERGTPR